MLFRYLLSILNSVKIHIFKGRKAWFFIALTALILELIALYLQHIMLLKPCVLCVYQRCALFGIVLIAFLMSITPPYAILRIIGLLFWIYSAWQGLILAKKQNDIESYSSPFNTCDFFARFPAWLPLDKWIPSIFYASGDCTEQKWYFLTMEISHWTIIIFLTYLVIPIGLLLTYILQYIQNKKNKR